MEKRTAMKKELKEKYDAFRKKCEYEGNFKMVIFYVIDKGFSAVSEITQEDIEDMIQKLKDQEKNSPGFMIMTPDFQGWLVEMATELIKIGKPFDLLKYIQNEIWLG